RDGVETRITPRSMDVLNYLAENAGTVISPDELLGRFWPGSVSSDHAVHKAVAELRSALCDDAHNPAYIKTFPKRGYALIAETGQCSPDSQTGGTGIEALVRPGLNPHYMRASFAILVLLFAAVLFSFSRSPSTTA